MNRFKFSDVVRLLIGDRPERFPYERAINLFQFQVWMLYPEQQFVELAGLTAATKILDRIQDYIFAEQEDAKERTLWHIPLINLNDRPPLTLDRISALRGNLAFGAVYDSFVANLGGLPALLYALPPPKLDAEIRKRIESCPVVSDLIDYRLRYAHTIGADGEASTLRHAKFFVWWPTRQMTAGRGVRLPEKSPSTKTMDKWWKEWRHTSAFLFLNHRCGFCQFPAAADDDLFVDNLLKSANDVGELRRFFGSYAFLEETITPGKKAPLEKIIPATIPRVALEVMPFTPEELGTIAAYKTNNFLLETYKLGDDD